MSLSAPFTLELTAVAHGGTALGRHEGRVIFVPYALPGEMVRVEVVEEQQRYAHARLLEVLTPSADRVQPPCPYFGRCGGCHWQHAAYQAQLRFKTQVVTDQLTRIGRLSNPPVEPTLADPTGWAYRNQARFHPATGEGLGFYTAGGEEVVPIETCLILHPLLSELYDLLDLDLPNLTALTLRCGAATQELMIVLETADDEPPALLLDLPVSCALLLSDGTAVNLIGSNHFHEVIAGRTYRVSAPSFFQANSEQAARLVELALAYLEPQSHQHILDGYCGVGLFTVPLAEQAGLVTAVEEHTAAVEDLLVNTEEMDNVIVVEGTVEAALANLEAPLDAALVDPPRTGLTMEALGGLVAAAPQRLVYVSCDPATLARDSRALVSAGYRLDRVQPLDMFPQTHHIETISRWTRTG
jgi:23S rRNA (uracil1939-C5)-methyltransferase